MSPSFSLFQDARDYQIFALATFLMLGIGTRDWTLRPELIAVTLLTCLITQGVAVFLLSRTPTPPPLSIRSALITGLGLCLLLRADTYLTMMLAAMAAIASKFLLQIHHKHCFNPANFGIISVLLLTPDAWVSPGQWGEEWWYGLLFVGLGGMVLQRVGRWDTTAAFLGTYAGLEALRNLWLGWTWDVYAHRLMSGSLLLFALFMLTDPRSIPNARAGRLLWAVLIALLTFVLRNQFFVSTALLWALFLLSPLTLLLDLAWAAPQFRWLHQIDSETAVTPV